MDQHIFSFKTDIVRISIPEKMNNPFAMEIPEIVKVAAKEFQAFISSESKNWEHDFRVKKGKMFGILVVQKTNGSYAFLGTNSGKLPGNVECNRFVPSVFDDSTDDYFINRGMKELSEIGNKIKETNNESKIKELTERRKQKSFALQQQLFENYRFSNINGHEQNVLQIFELSRHGKPPAAAGECAAPKLLQYAFKHQLKPIALAEFWWGKSTKNEEREHKHFYPACRNKCRPILEYILNDTDLFKQGNAYQQKNQN
ncbi:hypothetical protein [Carboxylicivirga sp. N1Y90]|uniref:hypothetical protein n=1 Tax=Carboxylicivirga fragile TaxID=3417571 RepID=UPI003D33314C|nr:hypothetical protein [Marinilabiliaceae bacterium N1Y90]